MLDLVMETLVESNNKQQTVICSWQLWCWERRWFTLSVEIQLFLVGHHLGVEQASPLRGVN